MIEYVLSTIILVQAVMWHFERKDLYNRLMCKDIKEYKSLVETKPTQVKTAHQKALNKWQHKDN